jgi:hypothetical protein
MNRLASLAKLCTGSVLVLGSIVALGQLVPGACASGVSTRVAPPQDVPPGETFVIAAAGDIAGDGHRDDTTAELLERLVGTHRLAAILALGDLQYPSGDLADFEAHFAKSWGRPSLRPYLRPIPGNHEYKDGPLSAPGYFDYFNGRDQPEGVAGARWHGYYSYELGNWQLIALNTSDGCRAVSCAVGSTMYRWLERTLKARRRPCVLAYFHHPRFHASDAHGDAESTSDIWQLLYAYGADIVLSGHAHNFQQLAPLDGSGRIDRDHGVRSFVVGTGGAPLHPEFSSARNLAALEARVSERVGVLVLELSRSTYGWQFLAPSPSGGSDVLASGRDRCRDPRLAQPDDG